MDELAYSYIVGVVLTAILTIQADAPLLAVATIALGWPLIVAGLLVASAGYAAAFLTGFAIVAVRFFFLALGDYLEMVGQAATSGWRHAMSIGEVEA